jgi:hypothetical protein
MASGVVAVGEDGGFGSSSIAGGAVAGAASATSGVAIACGGALATTRASSGDSAPAVATRRRDVAAGGRRIRGTRGASITDAVGPAIGAELAAGRADVAISATGVDVGTLRAGAGDELRATRAGVSGAADEAERTEDMGNVSVIALSVPDDASSMMRSSTKSTLRKSTAISASPCTTIEIP